MNLSLLLLLLGAVTMAVAVDVAVEEFEDDDGDTRGLVQTMNDKDVRCVCYIRIIMYHYTNIIITYRNNSQAHIYTL